MAKYRDDEDEVLVRPKGSRKSTPLVNCTWAAGSDEAKFYSGTPAHFKACEFWVNQMTNNPAWFKARFKKDLKSLNRSQSRGKARTTEES